mmetsp:Transcript_23280/g.36415  ORF Transcript_23280/g.36415 Transcript_23280/m.36415 type:complete len:133 (-) Transcript_23280:32-430(-)
MAPRKRYNGHEVDDVIDVVSHSINAAAAARMDTTSRSKNDKLKARNRSIDFTNVDCSEANCSFPSFGTFLRRSEKQVMPITPDIAPMALNTPIDFGDSPMVIRYDVSTTPEGLNAVKYNDAIDIVSNGNPDG